MAEMRLALRNYGTQGAEYQQILAITREECDQEAEDTIARNRCIIDDLICQQTTDAQLWVEFKGNSERLLADLKEVLDQAKEARIQVQAGFTTVKRSVVELATSSITAWTQRHEHVQSDVCALSESLSEGLQKAVCTVHQVCAATGEQALSCAAQAEQLQQVAPARVESLLEQVESQCAHLSSVSSAISSSLQLAAEEVSFIAEDHVKYQPTGNTPVRKEYEYPRTLDATSPHDRILEEFRANRKNLNSYIEILNCSSEEEELSRQESSGTSSLPSTTSMDELEASPPNEALSTKAVSGSEPNLSMMSQDDKENISAARLQSVSKLPVKVTQSTKKSSCCKQILTPRN